MNSIAEYYRRYENVIRVLEPGADRDKVLSRLMEEIKREFGIPLLQDEKWERENKAVIALYRIIAQSRTTV